MALDRLPTAEEGVNGLLRLADEFGPEATFQFLTWVLTTRTESDSVRARHLLARRMVDEEARTCGDRDDARRVVAERLGYTDKTRTNFYKVEQGLRRATGNLIPESR